MFLPRPRNISGRQEWGISNVSSDKIWRALLWQPYIYHLNHYYESVPTLRPFSYK